MINEDGNSQKLQKSTKPIPKWLEFDSNYAFNDPEMDKEHEEMFEILQALYHSQFSYTPNTQIAVLLNSLLQHLESHFQNEELLQRQLGYPDHEDHMIEHAQILIELRELVEKQRAGLCSFGDLFRFMAVKLVNQHLNVSDKKFYQWKETGLAGTKA